MRSFVFRCPETAIDLIIAISTADRTRLILEDIPFSFECPCCEASHQWRLREARRVKHRDDKAA
jgi:hypothetical protein